MKKKAQEFLECTLNEKWESKSKKMKNITHLLLMVKENVQLDNVPTKYRKDRKGRIPFAMVGIVIMLLTVSALSVLTEHNIQKGKELSRHTIADGDDMAWLMGLSLETKAYYIAQKVLEERMTVPPESDTRNLDLVDEMVWEQMNEHINNTYPIKKGIFYINITDWDVNVITDEMHLIDLVKQSELSEGGKTYIIDNSSLLELSTNSPPFMSLTTKVTYFRIVGHSKFEIYNFDEKTTHEKYTTFNKNLYSPLPLMKNLGDRFKCDGTGELSSIGRMIQYMMGTVAQYRVICGYGSGGYGGEKPNREIDDIITVEDVEVAVNLALLLTQARYFRDWDEEAASAQKAGNNEDFLLEKLMSNYVNNGSIDPADLIGLYNDLENETMDIGRIFAQSVYSFGDRFIWELLDLFWGEEWDENQGTWDAETYFDPVLDEPLVSWKDIEKKDDLEGWCRERLWHYLGVVGKWLGLTNTGDEEGDIFSIQAQAEESSIIKDIYARYRHPPQAGENVGKPSGSDLCNVPTPPGNYGIPNYYLSGTQAYHVDGNYYLFGNANDGSTATNRWYVNTYVRDEESNQGDTTDARYLMLGESPAVDEGEEGRPHTYKMTCRDDWNSGVEEKTYEYYAVKESLIEKHKDYLEGQDPYYSTFRFIVETLNRTMKQKSNDVNETDSKGMMDLAAHDINGEYGEMETQLELNPKDDVMVINHEIRQQTNGEEGIIANKLGELSNHIDQEKSTWFQQGCYINDSEDPENTGEYFLFDLMRETVDLWYETAVSLYDGGFREFDENGESQYGPQDGPEHWNNYDNNPNSQLPDVQFQTSKHETEYSNDKLAGSFKLRNDALRDCYHRVMEIVKTRDDNAEFSFANWEDMGSEHWSWVAKGSCGQNGVLYGWVYSGSGNAAVPAPDQQMIPRECYDGTGEGIDDFTPWDEPWKYPSNAYAEGIWDVLKNGNSGGTNIANDDPGEGIEISLANVVGDSDWPESTNHGLLDDITEEHMDNMDDVTDQGEYGVAGGDYDFGCNFYSLVEDKIGVIFIDDNALWDKLGREEGWLTRIISDEMTGRIEDNMDIFNIPHLTASAIHVPWELWHGEQDDASRNGSLFSEEFVVDQIPDTLTDQEGSLDIEVNIPENGTHLVDAQDKSFSMANDCFNTVWWINITGNNSYKIRNSRLSSIVENEHRYFWYNFSMDFDMELPISIYSGWDLESGWREKDIRFKMSRQHFNKMDADDPSDPFFISKEMVETIDGTKDSLDWALDSNMMGHEIILHTPHTSCEGKRDMLANLSSTILCSVDPRENVMGLLENASANEDYMNNISENAEELKAEMDEYNINYFGYPAMYRPNEKKMLIRRGDIDGTNISSGLRYNIQFDSDIVFSGQYRARNTIKFNSQLSSTGDGSFRFSGKIAPYNTIDEGMTYNFSIRDNVPKQNELGNDGAINNLFLPRQGKRDTVKFGITSSTPIPNRLKKAIEDTNKFQLERYQNETLLKQTEMYIKYFLGVLYNECREELENNERIGMSMNITGGGGHNAGFTNHSLMVNLTNLIYSEAERTLKNFIRHLTNSTNNLLDGLFEPAITSSFFITMPREIRNNIVQRAHFERERGDAGDIFWEGTMSFTRTQTPFMGTQWNEGVRWFQGGQLYPDGNKDLYLLYFSLDMGM